MGFYYDDAMNDLSQSMSIYLYKAKEDSSPADLNMVKVSEGKRVGRSELQTRANSSTTNTSMEVKTSDGGSGDIIELLRLPLNTDISVSTGFGWSTAPDNIASIAANIKSNLATTGLNALQSWQAIANIGKKDATYSQYAMYSANEYAKVFSGTKSELSIPFNGRIMSCVLNNTFKTPQEQLTEFFKNVYSEKKTGSDKSITESLKAGFAANSAKDSGSWWANLINKVAGGVNTVISTLAEGLVTSSDNLIVLSPPHSYTGPPKTFLDGEWLTGTLAVRYGRRYVYNLLLQDMSFTLSKEYILQDSGTVSPICIGVNLTLIPAFMTTPNDLKDYLGLTDIKDSGYSTVNLNDVASTTGE